MKLTESTLRKLRITDVQGLDPIDVYLEDFGPGRGQLTINCYGKSWTTLWGAMGDTHDLISFVRQCDPDYIANRFDSNVKREQFSSDALVTLAKKTVCDRRRGRGDGEPLDAVEARDLYERIEGLEGSERIDLCPPQLMSDLFGAEWWFACDRATEPNPDYLYLCRIIGTVQEALSQMAAPAPTDKPAEVRAARRNSHRPG